MRKTLIECIERPLVPATASSKALGYLRVGSAQSRAAARALVESRKAIQEDQIRFVVRSIVTGEMVNLDELAKEVRTTR